MAKCPAHPDRSPSLSILQGLNGRVLLRCFAGCKTEDVLEKLCLTWAAICGEPMTPAQAQEQQ
jgi:putative DNA primase/helicase